MMDDTAPRTDLPRASMGEATATHPSGRIGKVTVVAGFKLSCVLFGADAQTGIQAAYERVQIGDLIKVPTSTTTAFGFVDSLALQDSRNDGKSVAVAAVELLGETIARSECKTASFTPGLC